jgi:hypothetical protein
MYETKSQSLKSFVEDENIKLPRFQRKLTWNKKKNFYLTVSVFKNYPLGVTILRLEQDPKNKVTTKWLLDGRQRRHALKLMLTDPVEIYEWAKAALGIKNGDNSLDIKTKFRDKINEYIEYEPYSDEEADFNKELDSEAEVNNLYQSETKNTSNQEINEEFNSISELEFLLSIILIAHLGKKGSNLGLTVPFIDLNGFTNKPLSFFENSKINSKKLRDFIENYKKYCTYESIDFRDKESFKTYFKTEMQFNDSKKTKFDLHIDQNWDDELKKIIEVYTKLNDLFSNGSIGTIEIREIKDHDAQKIFNLINTGGTKLTAAEILAARPIWNKFVVNPSNELIQAKNELYKQKAMTITPEGVTIWDVAATFIDRIKNMDLFFNERNFVGESGVAKKITISFKLLSAIVTKGIKKEDIDEKLSANLDWVNSIDDLVKDLNDMFKLLKESSYFSTFSSWNKSLSSLIGDSPTLYFIAKCYMDWVAKDKSTSNSKAIKFKKNAFMLVDQLFFEFITRQWRGSSDSKVGKNLTNFKGTDELYIKLPYEDWNNLINSMFIKFKIGNEEINPGDGSKILYHYYSIKGIKGPDDDSIIVDVDHIYPQTLVEESSLPEKKKIKDATFNLGLLPKKNNISKGRRRLIEISTNTELVDQIVKYEEIKKDMFEYFSDLNNWSQLRDLKKKLFEEAFSSIRDNLLNN